MPPLKLVVHGAAGRMGRQVVAAADGSPEVAIVAGLVRPGSPVEGQDVGTVAGLHPLGVPCTTGAVAALESADVGIDVSVPTAAMEFVWEAARTGKPVVVATTGFSAAQLAEIRTAAEHAPILVAPNLSLGINLLVQILPLVARALGENYDVELVELHHRHKKDAPSGTALRLAEAIAAARERPLGDVARYGREGIAPRQSGEIGVHAVRAGGIVGEHHVIFANEGEQIEIVHRSFSRETFARGALRAARFLAARGPGLYGMHDVLG